MKKILFSVFIMGIVLFNFAIHDSTNSLLNKTNLFSLTNAQAEEGGCYTCTEFYRFTPLALCDEDDPQDLLQSFYASRDCIEDPNGDQEYIACSKSGYIYCDGDINYETNDCPEGILPIH